MNVMYNYQQISSASRLFSSGLLHEFSRKGFSPQFSRIVEEIQPTKLVSVTDRVSQLFDRVFALLKKEEFRNEYVYKSALVHKVLLGSHSLKTTAMLSEFRVDNSKADVVMLNGTSTVYEIKSERDTLKRLQHQIDAYRKVFARVNVIAGANHVDAVRDLVDDDVGVLLLTDRYQISTIRKAKDAPERTETDAIFNAIQLSEAKQILQNRSIEIPELPNTKMYKVLQEKFSVLKPEEAHEEMVQILKKTRSSAPLEDFIAEIPYSLRAGVLSAKVRKCDRGRLLRALNKPIKDVM